MGPLTLESVSPVRAQVWESAVLSKRLMVGELVHEESWAGAGAAVGLAAAQGASQSLEVVGVHLHPALIFLLTVAFFSFLAGWWLRGVAGRWYEWADLRFFRNPLVLGPAPLTGSARIFDCGRGQHLPTRLG